MTKIFKIFASSGLFLLMVFFIACNSHSGFDTTKNGLKYKFHIENKDSKKVELYDVVEVSMNYRSKDSILYAAGRNTIPFQINPIYDGDLMEGMMMMHLGDSATFVIDAEGFFIKMMDFERLPDYVQDGEDLYFDIQIKNIKPETPGIQKRRIQNEERKAHESELLSAYISNNHISIKPEESGYYFIPMKKGSGQAAKTGQQVSVHYKGYFLDGKPYDSSYDKRIPVTFTLGAGEVISGWEKAVEKMVQGDKVKLILPSELAFGASQRDNVEPYTPMIFELELIEVK